MKLSHKQYVTIMLALSAALGVAVEQQAVAPEYLGALVALAAFLKALAVPPAK